MTNKIISVGQTIYGPYYVLSNNETVTNSGTINGGLQFSGASDVFANQASGTAEAGANIGFGVRMTDGGTIANSGKILDNQLIASTYNYGISIKGGAGTITNTSGGTISSYSVGVYIGTAGGTVTNAGTISGGSGAATAAGVGIFGVEIAGGAASVTNSGTISAIDGGYGVYIAGANASVTNSGTISGSYSLSFAGAGANTLTLQTGSTLVGAAHGSTAGGATNALVLQGTGTADNLFVNFTSIDVQAGASWTLGADDSFGSASVEGALNLANDVAAAFTIHGGTLKLGASAQISGGIDFASATGANGGTLDLTGKGSGFTLADLISGFTGTGDTAASSDLIEVAGSGATDHLVWSDIGGVGTLKVENASNSVLETLIFHSSLATSRFVLSQSAGVDQIAYNSNPPCYVAGTRLATDAGEAAVEELRVGERLATAYGGSRPIVWIGHRALNAAAHPAPEKVWPVRVSAGAFGADQPTRDLWLSPGHSVAVSGVLIPIGHLINGRSVVQVEAEEVEYFHVELDCHDIVLAEGLPAESYLDAGNRSDFANGGAFVTAHPEFAPRACDETCLRLVHEGPQVVAARALLLAQLAERGDALTTAADAHLVADGLRIAPMPLGARRFAFVLPEGCKTIELRSRTYVPAHAELANPDRRRLGLCVGRLQIDGDEMALDDATLGDAGWHEAERRDDHIDRRWTRGAAPLPAGARLVIVDLAGDGYYWREPRPCVVAGVEAA